MKWIRQILQFSTKQANGFMLLVFLVLFAFLVPEFYFRHFFKSETFSEVEQKAVEGYFRDMDSLEREWQQKSAVSNTYDPQARTGSARSNDGNKRAYTNYGARPYQQRQTQPINQLPAFEPFMFDPNAPDSIPWLKLHLRPRQILTIKNYLRKGGKFRFKEDFRKIYGLSEEQYLKLRDYMLLPSRDSVAIEVKKSDL